MIYTYITTNKINSKQYVGSHETDNINDGYLGSGRPYFINALKKYGKKNFKREIISFYKNIKTARKKESYYIKKYSTLVPNGYNISPTGGTGINGKHSKYSKKKMSESHKGQIPWNKGKTLKTDNRLMKMSESLKGMKAWNKGKKGVSKKNKYKNE